MATTVLSGQVAVGTAAVAVTTGVVGASHLYLHAPTAGQAIHIGGAAVTTSDGFELHKGEVVEFWLPESATLYAVAASGTTTISWLLMGGR